jgi:hypothetical protein
METNNITNTVQTDTGSTAPSEHLYVMVDSTGREIPIDTTVVKKALGEDSLQYLKLGHVYFVQPEKLDVVQPYLRQADNSSTGLINKLFNLWK